MNATLEKNYTLVHPEKKHDTHLEVCSPVLKLLYPQQQIGVPLTEAEQRGIRPERPRLGNIVKVQRITKIFHISGDCELPLQGFNGHYIEVNFYNINN